MCSLLLKDLSFNFYAQMGKLHVDLDYFYDCVKDELDVRLNVHFISSNAKKVFFSSSSSSSSFPSSLLNEEVKQEPRYMLLFFFVSVLSY